MYIEKITSKDEYGYIEYLFCSIKMNLYNDKVTNMNKAKKRMNELGSEQKKSRRKCWIFVIYSWDWLLQIISFN